MIYFPFADYWWFYLAFTAVVLFLLALDLGVFHRTSKPVSFRESAIWSAIWIGTALIFNFLFYRYVLWKFAHDTRLLATPGFDPGAAAREVGLQFLSGYVVEKALSLDNIFVFVVLFSAFGIPAMYHRRVLFYGILGALVFRAAFIAAGAKLLQIHWIMLAFGALLILTGAKMMFMPERPVDPEKSRVLRLFRRFLPVTPTLEGDRFLVKKNGVRYATPLLLALALIEVTDILFAMDSVPAVFGLTREPLIVFTSNVFAILGLRALYFLLSGAVERFHLLKYGLAAVLIFVGLKMVWLNDAFDGEFPIGWSLGIICALVALAIAASFLIAPKKSEAA